MKFKVISLVIVLLAILGVWKGLDSVQANRLDNSSNIAQESSQLSKGDKSEKKEDLKTVIDDQGGIQVGVVWEKQLSSANQKFRIEINNHSVSFDNYDFASNIRLSIEGTSKKSEVKVLNREGSGHHASAEISVETPELAKLKPGGNITLLIDKLGNTPVRKFDFVY